VVFKYRPRAPFVILRTLAEYEFDEMDHFIELANKAQRSRKKYLEQLGASKDAEELNDWLVDDFAQLDDFSDLTTEFAILGLWRCVELYRTRSICNALGKNAAKGVFKNKQFKEQLAQLGIQEENIRCAQSIDELRCLNNAIKHEKRVGKELCRFASWKNMQGKDLPDLGPHYRRLQPLARGYIEDLTHRLSQWWEKKSA